MFLPGKKSLEDSSVSYENRELVYSEAFASNYPPIKSTSIKARIANFLIAPRRLGSRSMMRFVLDSVRKRYIYERVKLTRSFIRSVLVFSIYSLLPAILLVMVSLGHTTFYVPIYGEITLARLEAFALYYSMILAGYYLASYAASTFVVAPLFLAEYLTSRELYRMVINERLNSTKISAVGRILALSIAAFVEALYGNRHYSAFAFLAFHFGVRVPFVIGYHDR